MPTVFTRRLVVSLALAFLFLVGIMYAWPGMSKVITPVTGPIANTSASAITNVSTYSSLASSASDTSPPSEATLFHSTLPADHEATQATPIPGNTTQTSNINTTANITMATTVPTTTVTSSPNVTVTPVPNSTVSPIPAMNGSIGGRISSPSGNRGTIVINDANGSTLGSASTQTLKAQDGFWLIDHLPLNKPLAVQASSGPYSTGMNITLTPDQPTAILSFTNWTGNAATPTPNATSMPTPALSSTQTPDYGFSAKTWFDPKAQKHYISVTNDGNQLEAFGIMPVNNTSIPGGSEPNDIYAIPSLQSGQTSSPIEIILEPEGPGSVAVTQIRGWTSWSQIYAVS